MKKILEAIIFVLILAGMYVWYSHSHPHQQSVVTTTQSPIYKNIAYTIDGQLVTLIDGRAEVPSAPGSASKTVTQYFGNEAVGDLNGDGKADTAFILTQSGGGSGTFYYVVVALKTAAGYEGTNAILLGDRIAPQSTTITGATVQVNYADRAAQDPMTTVPSIGSTKYVTVQQGVLVETPSHI